MMKPKFNYKPGTQDDCQTPGYAIAPIVKILLERNITLRTIWEPCTGEGYMAREFEKFGFKVEKTDIKTGQDFFTYTPDFFYSCIITNPPFSLKYYFIERCYELEKPFALLMPIDTLGAKFAQDLFKKYGISVILMDKRINFKMPNIGWRGSGSQFSTAWFTYGMNVNTLEYYSFDWLTQEKRKEWEF